MKEHTIVVIIFIVLASLSYFGVFSKKFVHHSIVMAPPKVDPIKIVGGLGLVDHGQNPIDWISNVEYIDKGAFVVNNKIKVKAKFIFNNNDMFKKYKGYDLCYAFDHTQTYRSYEDESADPKKKWWSKTITSKETTLEGKIQYTIPGAHKYNILIIDKDSDEIKFQIPVPTTETITIAPPEVSLQIKNNNIMLGLAFIGIMIAILQLLGFSNKP